MRDAALRLTPQRRAVLEELRASPDHPTASELLRRLQRRRLGTSPATVYRSLDVLVRAGLAVELKLDGGPARYDGDPGHHDHLVCTRCRRVVDIRQPEPDLSGVRETGFTVTGYDLRVRGLCPACQRGSTADTAGTGRTAGDGGDLCSANCVIRTDVPTLGRG